MANLRCIGSNCKSSRRNYATGKFRYLPPIFTGENALTMASSHSSRDRIFVSSEIRFKERPNVTRTYLNRCICTGVEDKSVSRLLAPSFDSINP